MEDLFGSDNLIDIEVNYKVEKNKSGVKHIKILNDDDVAKIKADISTANEVKTLSTKWIQQTWAAANELLKRATIYNHQTSQQDIDWTAYRDARLKSCLVEWDAKDKNDSPIPCNEFTINKLHANVALALLERYDKATSIDEEEKVKN